jgi:CelD/BcsL family acetyltransferase involved in cellulose biosynthesis
LLRAIAHETGMRRSESYRYQRATMIPREMGDAYLTGPLSSRNKKLRSQKNKLGKQGEVRFEVLRGPAIDDAAIERHLALEHMGWKGESGTSMRSNPAHEAFFRDVAAGFAADDRALFAQLSVGDHVIASTSNFIAGKTGFAFKIGFDPAYSQFGPGTMCELEFMRCAPDIAGDLDSFDSGAVAGSYLEAMWPERDAIATVAYSTSLAGNLAMACNTQLRRIKQMVSKRTSRAPTAPAPATQTADE